MGFTPKQLGFPISVRLGMIAVSIADIYKKSEELGLELCPAEVGPHLRLQYPGKEWMTIAMKQIPDRGGVPFVFMLTCFDTRLDLSCSFARPSVVLDSHTRFIFRFRK